MTYKQEMTKKQVAEKIATTDIAMLTNRKTIPSYCDKIKTWLADATITIPSPVLTVVRISLPPDQTISAFFSWMKDYHRKHKDGRRSASWLWCKEVRGAESGDYTGLHYHIAFVTSGGQTSSPAQPFILAQKKGRISNYWVSRELPDGVVWLPYEQQHNLPTQHHQLRTQNGLADAMKHIAYFAKVETKEISASARSIGCGRS